MKKAILLLTVLLSLTVSAQPPCTFSIAPPNGPYSITCTNTFVVMTASPGSLTYTWTSLANPPVTGVPVTFTSIGVYTVSGSGPGCTASSQTFAIVSNTTPPTSSVSPNSQVTSCATLSPVTFSGTVTNPTVNIQHDWYSPLSPLPGGPPISTSNNTMTILSGNIAPGVYTLVTTNLVNGCTTQKTVTVTSLSAYPTFNISSPTNFSLGCVPLNQTTISIINPVSTQTPPATCSYTFLAPGFGGTLAAGPYSGNTSTVTAIPGTWTVIVNDNSNNCKTILSVPVIQNTVGPNVSATMLTQTLTCTNPTVFATGTSTTPNTTINWGVPSTPPLLSTPTVIVGPPNGPNTSTTSLTYATYTVIATNTLNACQSTSIVTINQNFKPPVPSPTISIATATAIYCTASVNPVVLTTGNSTTTSGGVNPPAFVINPCWAGPSPQTATCSVNYSCYVAGVYTLTIGDNYNGCTASGTINVLDRTQPPVLQTPVATSTLDCGSGAASMSIALSQTMTGGVRYFFKQYPPGTAFTPNTPGNTPITTNLNPLLSGTSSSLITASSIGQYVYVVSNTLTGCTATGTYNVASGDLNSIFEASPVFGYAPLTVNFTNNSASSLNSNSITSVWSFGNGVSQTFPSTIATSNTYNSPGTYTVMLLVSKGNCIDTSFKTIKVEIPSKLEVPNVFTPNGDGSNDVFFLKVANLTEITAVILDRWGNKVYEVTSNTGNIAWDGKNQEGKECASGVYFYVIKATGKDDKAYENKGNVSLYR